MQTSTLLKLSLATAIIGLVLLFFLSERLEPKLIPISEIDDNMLDKFVKISGKVVAAKETEGLYILDVSDGGGNIDVVVFKQGQKLSFQKGQSIEVIGKVSEFRFKLQVEGREIRAS